MRRSISILTLVLCLAAPAVYAEVIVFDNSPPDQSSGNEMTQWIQAEDIPLAAPITFDRIRFWSLEDLVFGTGYAGSIDWFLYSEVLVPVEGDPTNLMGQPGAVLYSGSTAAVTRTFLGTANGPGFSEYVNLFVTGPITLAAGNYWLGLHNGPAAGPDAETVRREFYWETADANLTEPGQEFDLSDPAVGWPGFAGAEHAFQLALETPVGIPEPGSLSLLLLGLGSVLFAGRARRRAR